MLYLIHTLGIWYRRRLSSIERETRAQRLAVTLQETLTSQTNNCAHRGLCECFILLYCSSDKYAIIAVWHKYYNIICIQIHHVCLTNIASRDILLYDSYYCAALDHSLYIMPMSDTVLKNTNFSFQMHLKSWKCVKESRRAVKMKWPWNRKCY